ncbi:MAG: DNA repair protein RecN, partial [Sphaerochaetaceae bacterium]
DTAKERLNSLSFSQFLLDEKQNRLALIQRLKRKYGPTLENVISFLDESKNKLDNLENSTDNLTKTEKIIKEQEIVVSNLEQSLSNKRKEAAKKLEKLIQSRLSLLGMPDVNFCVEVKQGERRFSGIDYINFLFSANLGEPLKNLKEIASGGELSRVMLAIKTVLSEADDIQTLVFDEVDAGIGVKVALDVGSQMAELAKSRQVIAITHLASIASKAQTHFVVNKETIGGRTYTKIGEVSSSERVKELARMLSGDKEGEAAIKHAETLIN